MDRDKGMRHPSQNFPLLDGSWVSAWPNTPTGEESSSARTSCHRRVLQKPFWGTSAANRIGENGFCRDRKSTRLNSSHRCISYAVFCLKKKTNNIIYAAIATN